MKNFIILIILQFSMNIFSQNSITLGFEYDKSGNLAERKVQVVNLGKISNSTTQEDSISKTSLFKISPNPSSTYLFVEPKENNELINANIELCTITGQFLKSIPYFGENLKLIDVSNLQNGLYLLTIHYSLIEKEVHKIIITN